MRFEQKKSLKDYEHFTLSQLIQELNDWSQYYQQMMKNQRAMSPF